MLSSAAIQAFISEQYQLEPIETWVELATTFHRLYLIHTSATAFVLRISSADPESLRFDEARLTLLSALAAADVPVVQPIQRRDSGYSGPFTPADYPCVAVLYAYVPGLTPGRTITAAQSGAFGRALARLHHATSDGSASCNLPDLPDLDLIDQPAAVIAAWPDFQHHTALHSITTIAKQMLHTLPQTSAAFGFCHGDVHPMNVIINAENVTLLDFEWSGYGWRSYDLATFLWAIGGTPAMPQLRDSFLDGYQTIRSLTAQERAILPFFIGLRHLLLTSKIISYAQVGIDTGRAITTDFLGQRLAQVQRWFDAAE